MTISPHEATLRQRAYAANRNHHRAAADTLTTMTYVYHQPHLAKSEIDTHTEKFGLSATLGQIISDPEVFGFLKADHEQYLMDLKLAIEGEQIAAKSFSTAAADLQLFLQSNRRLAINAKPTLSRSPR